MMLSSLGLVGRPPKPLVVHCGKCQRLSIHYMKVNVDGGASGAPANLIGGGVFQDSFGVFKGCFATNHGTGFAFEAELATAFYAIELAQENGWTTILMECDSTYVVQIFRAREPNILWRLLAQA
ncbi:hypothetical protein ACS0TY_029790 [Phlomoides rotata]